MIIYLVVAVALFFTAFIIIHQRMRLEMNIQAQRYSSCSGCIQSFSFNLPHFWLHLFYLLISPSLSRPPFRCLSRPRLHDLPWRLGQWRGPTNVRRANGQIQPGRLLSALGLHLGHHGHPGRPHPVLPGLCSGEPTGWAYDRGAAGWKQGWGCANWADNMWHFVRLLWPSLNQF